MRKKLFFIFLLVVCLMLFLIWQGIYLPKNLKGEERVFKIERGEGLRTISFNLEKEGLIKSRLFFQIYVLSKGVSRRLQAGYYLLSPSMTIPEIAQKFVSGDVVKIKIIIPEGFNLTEIVEKLSRSYPNSDEIKDMKVSDFLDDFDFLANAPPKASLEGFLFPDTYQFSYDENTEGIVKKMLDNFNKRLTKELRNEIEEQGKTIFEIVTMASMLEKEVKNSEDKKLVSGILWKRLKKGIPLQVDATITYITGKKTTEILVEETQIDSPYNTYKYLGLPIGPICNPGLDSILAAIYPKESEYWYYLSTPDGKTIFNKTLKEHNLAKEKYLH